ncbi:MAG TPA: hypothetical protein VL860_04450, partial [Planctomycetota bacterium]|nr:hypothetical protein [Planctomycetota bacterium]
MLVILFTAALAHAADTPAAPPAFKLEAPDIAPFLQNLNGVWELAAPGSEEFKPAQVPGLWNQVGGKDSQEWLTATYRREFTLPANTHGAALEFDALTWGGEVLLNGHSAGDYDLGYAGHTFDLSEFLQPGVNKLTVKPVGWKAIPRYPGGMTKIPVGVANWFGNKSGGIPGDVRLRLYDGARIDQFRVYPQVLGANPPGCKISIPVLAGNKDFTGTLCVQILSDDAKQAVAAVWRKPLKLKSEEWRMVETELLPIPGGTLWCPATPLLYRARAWLEKPATIEADAVSVASVRDETFGLREIAIKDGHLQLNCKPVALFGYTGVGAYFQFNLIADSAALKTYQV